MKNFPVYSSLAEAATDGCFNCKAPLPVASKVDTGFPDGRIRLTCEKCGYHTYLDVKEEA